MDDAKVVWLVWASSGRYEDRGDRAVRAFSSERQCHEFAALCRKRAAETILLATDDLAAWWANSAAAKYISEYDPEFSAGYECEITYVVCSIPFEMPHA